MAFSVRRKGKISPIRIGMKVVATVISLWIVGVVLARVGDVVINTSSVYYDGTTIIGWTVTDNVNGTYTNCGNGIDVATVGGCGNQCIQNCLTDTGGSGILTVVGLLGIVWVLFEFIQVRF